MEDNLENPKNGGKFRKYNHQQDRLSSLPDPILVEILSLLPIECATATSVLAKRWRHLWTQITTLQISFREPSLPPVDDILKQLTSPIIRALHIYDSGHASQSRDLLTFYISCCFAHVRHRNVEIIDVQGSLHRCQIKVPDWVFQCQSLVVLDLSGRLVCDFPDDYRTDLPCLKKLGLWISNGAKTLVVALTSFESSYPLLEELSLLFMWGKGEELFVDISAPNLKSLDIALPVRGEFPLKFVINAPKLLNFSVGDWWYWCRYTFINVPLALAEVSICTPGSWGYFGAGDVSTSPTAVPNLVWGISQVRNLYLNKCGKMINYLGCVDGGAQPIFHNLTLLQITLPHDCGLSKELLLSLRCFPNLEVLEVDNCPAMDVDWNVSESLPSYFLSKLKKLEIKDLRVNGSASKFLMYVLRNASSLEKLSVQVNAYSERNEERLLKEHEFCGTLMKLPRSSSTCVIEFDGVHIRASSKGLKK